MTWSSPDQIISRLLSGDRLSILLAFVISISLPVLVHLFLYSTSSKSRATPTFLLLGTVGGGKTSLLTVLQKHPSPVADPHPPSLTRTSQLSQRVTLSLPPTIPLGSNKYRSENDSSLQASGRHVTKYQLIDTPGHGKLRAEHALPYLDEPSLVAIIYVVDAAALGSGDDAGPLKETAAYLHDVLLHLQRRKISKGAGGKRKADAAVLIAANKQDLFQALPPGALRERLESGIERARQTKTSRLGDMGESKDDDEDGLLAREGGVADERFTFRRYEEEYGVGVEVVGGAVRGAEEGEEDGAEDGIEKWERWIGGIL